MNLRRGETTKRKEEGRGENKRETRTKQEEGNVATGKQIAELQRREQIKRKDNRKRNGSNMINNRGK